ncbi:MAG TPA: alginate export family protein [Longimicrobiales bacterium]|nr:alginate export family protein [Longimicrobiales bacterium]
MPQALARAAALVLVAVSTAVPADVSAQITFSGQVRPRTEFRDPATPDGGSLAFTGMRTRLAASVLTQGGARAFIQIQDVRLFGEEANTLGDYSADGLDVHQAWLLLGDQEAGASFKVGRQEVALGGERLIGAVGWAHQGRSFDGVRVGVRPTTKLAVDGLALQLSESAAPARNADALLWGAYGVLNPGGDQSLDLFVLTQRERGPGGDTDQVTLGARHVGTTGPVSYRVEGSLQRGTRQDRDVSAHMFGARVGASGSSGSVTLWYDYLSGTVTGSDEVGAFETLYATNHKFYGFADLFTDIPTHTGGRGLQDLALKGSTRAGPWSLAADLHRFFVARGGGLDGRHLADELDLTFSRRLPSGVGLTTGFSWVLEGGALEPVRGIRDDVFFGYVMLDLTF